MSDQEPTRDDEPPAAPVEQSEPVVEAEPVEPPRERRLERSRDDRVLAGVCGGLGEYFGVDAVLIRIAALLLVLAGGAGLLLYVIGWIAMPEAPERALTGVETTQPPSQRTASGVALGIVFMGLGAFFLLDELWSDFLAWKYVWPIVLIAVGAVVLARARR
jgi:phage shock protein C